MVTSKPVDKFVLDLGFAYLITVTIHLRGKLSLQKNKVNKKPQIDIDS